MKGRSVRIFLVDGIPTGLLTAEIINWIGKVTVAPRIQLADLAGRSEVRRTGLYILAGDDPDNPNQEVIYIGESDNVWSRLIQHNRDTDKDFWRRTVIITSKDDNLTKAHVRYLESRLIQLANQSQRARLLNGTNPDPTSLPESDVADMEYFLEQVQMLLPVLGLSFAIPLPTINIGQDTKDINVESPMLYMNYAGVSAYAQEINGEFIVLKGSTVRRADTPSLTTLHAQMRAQLYKDGKLADSDQADCWILTQDMPFSSPSAAASIISGAKVNGRILWKLKDSEQTYAAWQEAQIEQTEQIIQVEE